jgi:putative hydrolase of the HAD superfamily
MDFKGILFDGGNTLFYFDGNWEDVLARASRQLMTHLQSVGLDVNEGNFLSVFRRRMDEYYVQREVEFIEYTTARVLRDLLNELGYGELNAQVLETALKQFYGVSQAHWKGDETAEPTLKALQAAGYRLGVISNASDDSDVQTLIANAGLHPYLDFILTSAACGIRKPNPRIFEIALEKWGFAPSEAAMVGDTLGADILGARNAGLYSIWVTKYADKPGNHDHLDTIQPDAEIKTLAELPQLLKELPQKRT